MDSNCDNKHPLRREGTAQQDRFPFALEPAYVKVDERKVPDLIRFTAAFAEYIAFWPTDHPRTGSTDINWTVFFDEVKALTDDPANYDANGEFSFAALEENPETKPHIALFLSFLRLYGYAQDSLNQLTERHLDFYYADILRLKKKEAVPDKAAVFFEAAKEAEDILIPAGAELYAGKDATGRDLFYKMEKELLVNQARVEQVKTIFVEKKAGTNEVRGIFADPDTVKNAQSLPGGTDPVWRSFGNPDDPQAEVGFAFSSPILNQDEGERRIRLHIDGIVEEYQAASMIVYYTGAEKWVRLSNIIPREGYVEFIVHEKGEAIVPYNPAVHGGSFQTAYPIVKVLFLFSKNAEKQSYDFYRSLTTEALDGARLEVEIRNARNLILENDNGRLDGSRPFLPFGASPVVGSNFYIGYPRAFHGNLKNFSLSYITEQQGAQVLTNTFASLSAYRSYAWNQVPGTTVSQTGFQVINPSNSTNSYFSNQIQPGIESLEESQGGSFIKLTLTEPAMDNAVHSEDFTKKIVDGRPSGELPVKPPLLFLKELKLNYTLTAGLVQHTQFYHIHPFGEETVIWNGESDSLVPAYDQEGNLHIGLSGMKLPGQLSLYFQVLEDSGDLDKQVSPANRVQWFSLKNNQWIPLQAQQLLLDSTGGLTQSGIIRFALNEAGANTSHRIIPDGLVWLKASVNRDSGAYPALLNIRAQAGTAIFDNRDNDPLRLKEPLPAFSITKLTDKPDGINLVEQPFISYDGKMKEESRQFHTRISERLRHKNRSWQIWDYERMILEKFPFVYKTKCISHANAATELAPGEVLIVAIPRPSAIKTYNQLMPRISVGNLLKINEYINRFTTAFARVKVINPVYERIRVVADLMMHPAYNLPYYAEQLNEEIRAYLAPWTKASEAGLRFSSKLYESRIINLIDESPYVDYISGIAIEKWDEGENTILALGNEFEPASEKGILTSFSRHQLNINRPC